MTSVPQPHAGSSEAGKRTRVAPGRFPRVVSVREMEEIDQAAIHTLGIPRLLLMEHAGLAVARAARVLLENPQQAQDLVVCCGLGYNGGDGFCAAWHLAQWGYRPSLVLLGALHQLKEEPATYARILQALQIPMRAVTSLDELAPLQTWVSRCRLIIDALLGLGLTGPVRPLYAKVIELINQAHKPVVCVDVPSGLNADTGLPQGCAVKATVTVTFGLPKQGFFLEEGPAYVGDLVIDDIGMPPTLLAMR